MLKTNFKYLLRYAIEPCFHEEERLNVLLDFCKAAHIDDVMFFINGEEINCGHLTIEETKPWLKYIAEGKRRLEDIGVTASINPWPSLLHGDRGRRLKEGQGFTTLVDVDGQKSDAQACPLCPVWRKYIVEMYSYYAAIEPHMLWVEDDFRLHNHEPLNWGGCFCSLHMDMYSERAGYKLEREEFIKNLLKEGSPHPYRRIWLETNRNVMSEVAALIGRAVHSVSPGTRVALMSSLASIHCAEGRDWKGILENLSTPHPAINRPHLPAYSDSIPQTYLLNFNMLSPMYSAAFLPDTTEIYPEIENLPYSRFSKSQAFMRFQLDTSLIAGVDGATLNIFDMMGSGVMPEEGYDRSLAENKDFLNRIKALDLKRNQFCGVKIPVNQEASWYIHARPGSDMTGLYPEETLWAGLLSAYGIANYITSENEFVKESETGVVALSGQYLRGLSHEAIKHLFENNFILLEGEAAWTLFDMGQGYLAGITEAVWHEREKGGAAYEQMEGLYCGVLEPRMSAQNVSGDYLEIIYTQGVEVMSTVRKYDGSLTGNGMAVYEGRVFILPYGRFKGNFHAHLNPFRQECLQNILKKIHEYDQLFFSIGNPYIAVYVYKKEKDRIVLLIVNASNDELSDVHIHISSGPWRISQVITRDAGMCREEYAKLLEGRLILECFKPMDMRAVVLIKR